MSTSTIAEQPVYSEPTPWRKNRYAHMAFLQPTPTEGTINDGFGHRTLVAPLGWIADMVGAITREVGDAAAEILQKIGAACGAADMKAFAARSADEFGAGLPNVHMGVALQTWWWPWMAAGWGTATFNLQRAPQRLILIDVMETAVARATHSAARPMCDLYTGLFAGAFGQLSGRQVGCAEVQCRAAGASSCRFLVTTRQRAASAVAWRNSGAPANEIEQRLIASEAKDRRS
jgi:bacteriochlorophyll 4-vinyl reductase